MGESDRAAFGVGHGRKRSVAAVGEREALPIAVELARQPPLTVERINDLIVAGELVAARHRCQAGERPRRGDE